MPPKSKASDIRDGRPLAHSNIGRLNRYRALPSMHLRYRRATFSSSRGCVVMATNSPRHWTSWTSSCAGTLNIGDWMLRAEECLVTPVPVPLSSSAESTLCTQLGTFTLLGSRLRAPGRAPPFSVEMLWASCCFGLHLHRLDWCHLLFFFFKKAKTAKSTFLALWCTRRNRLGTIFCRSGRKLGELTDLQEMNAQITNEQSSQVNRAFVQLRIVEQTRRGNRHGSSTEQKYWALGTDARSLSKKHKKRYR